MGNKSYLDLNYKDLWASVKKKKKSFKILKYILSYFIWLKKTKALFLFVKIKI